MPRSTCACGGTCKGNPWRCAFNAHLQEQQKEAVARRRAELHVVEEPGDSIASVLVHVCEGRI